MFDIVAFVAVLFHKVRDRSSRFACSALGMEREWLAALGDVDLSDLGNAFTDEEYMSGDAC